MRPINKYGGIKENLKNNLLRVGDIIRFEDGPVLSLFQDQRNENLYLFDWVDSDNSYNRWIIYKINPELLNKFLLKFITYKDFFIQSLNNNAEIYYTDIDYHDDLDYLVYRIPEVPNNYFPDRETFFDEMDATNISNIFEVLNEVLQKSDKSGDYVNRVSYQVHYFGGAFILGGEEPCILEEFKTPANPYNSKNEAKILGEQQYAPISNRVPKQKRMGLLC